MVTSIGDASGGAGNGNGGDGPKVSRAHVESHPAAKSERTVTWPVEDGDALIGTVRLSKGLHECVLPDGTIIETFKTLKFAVEFLHQQGRPFPSEEQASRLKTDVDELSRKSPTERMFWLPDYAKRHGLAEAKLQQMIEAEIAANTKKALAQQEAERRREQREEKEAKKKAHQEKAKAEEEDRKDRRARRDARDQERADRRAQQRQRDIDRQLAIILKQPAPLWGSKRMAVLDGRQVRCLTFDEGAKWIHGIDELPLLVRRRLADARHNLCPTCIGIEAHNNANGPPSLKLYFAVIVAIERVLDQAERRFNIGLENR